MTGRRDQDRYLLTQPLDGHLRLREEVVIERWNGDEIIVISPVPSCRAERLTLELVGLRPPHLPVSVADSRPFITSGGSLRHRVRLIVCFDASDGTGRPTT